VNDEITRLLPALEGHFVFESGHHGTRWLELERLCYSPRPIRELATELAKRLSEYPVDMVCGPLVEGAFVALFVAEALGVPFTYTERQVTTAAGLYPVEYRLPGTLRDAVRGKTVAIVNDVINAGSGRNTATETKFPKNVLPGTFDLGFTNGLMAKDVGLAMSEAKSLGVPMEMGDVVLRHLRRACEEIGPAQDLTTIVQPLERRAGVEVRAKKGE